MVKKGQKYKAINSGVEITIVSKCSGNRHWNTKKNGSGKSHMIHEGTLKRFYELIGGS